jgi:cephalosporin-C deacetylase
MTGIHEKLRKLEAYKPTGTCPEDFAGFWMENLKLDNLETASLELQAISYPLPQVEVFMASLPAGDGVILKGYYLRPAYYKKNLLKYSERDESVAPRFPGLVRFHGYSGNRGQISELLFWALQGYAILGLDVRGQCGETPDGRSYLMGGFSGWMTLGLDSPQNHYFRQVYLDAVRAMEALSRQPEVDEKQIGVFGKSQGGGLAIIAAGLANGFGKDLGMKAQVKAVSAAIPFLADFRGGFEQHSDGPLAELSWYFRLFDPEHKREEEVFKVLDYFDAIHFASLFSDQVSCLVSIGLKDMSCPPPTIYALYNALSGKKKLLVYPEYGHESPDEFVDRQIEFLAGELLILN